MIPEEYQRLRSLLESALELGPSDRSRFLDDACPDASLRLEVESMIELHEQAGTDFLNSPAILDVVAADGLRFQLRHGDRIGAYEILEEIAQGGMGAVYRAVRADGHYTQAVAIKIVRAGFGTELTAARFLNERQILASLDHPNIAKILDGGTTADDLPFFVMELIDGLPITEYCDQKKLSIDARLRLFRTVCAAVQYAHQRLVIHRDIKPSNILVTKDGVPKLLDFGIAKVLNPSLSLQDLTRTAEGLSMMTPEYASPEQIRGETVTTATDAYSLGLVLYELLTGRRAYRVTGAMPHEVARVVCDVEPERPSVTVAKKGPASSDSSELHNSQERSALRDTSPARLQKKLRVDLDNVVLMALRKEPSRRYSSVEQFAEDIRRHLEHAPVIARESSAWYRASKFVARHRSAVVASLLMVITILTGLGITLYEARVAREQAEIARLQRARAERRFNDVRKLANSLMFEIHDSIKDLPGATPARKLLVERALEYLDSLSQESADDASLQRELASAYDRVGDLLGNTAAANAGDFPGALKSYNKALAIRQASAAANPNDVQIQSDLLSDYFRLSFVLQDTGDYAGAIRDLQDGLPVAQQLAAKNRDPKYQDWLAGLYWKKGNVLTTAGDNAQAVESFREALSIRQPIVGMNPIFRTHLAGDYDGLGKALGRTGDIDAGIEYMKSGVEILEQLSQLNPNNATLREYLGEAYSDSSVLFIKRGELDQALDTSKKSKQVFSGLLSADPTNGLARDNLALSELNSAEVLFQRRDPEESIPLVRKGIATFEAIQYKNRSESVGLADGDSILGRDFVALAQRNQSPAEKRKHLLEARSWFQKSLQASQLIPNPAIAGPSAAIRDENTQRELARCNAALAKLQSGDQIEGASPAIHP